MLNYISTLFRIVRLAFLEEFKRIFHDPGAMLILIGAMIIYPIVYSIAYKNNVLRNIPIAMVDLDHTNLSRKTTNMLNASQQMDITQNPGSLEEAQQLFWDGAVNGIIIIPNGYEKAVYRGEQTNLSVYCDATYFLMYKETLTGTISTIGTLGAGIEIKRLIASGQNMNQAIKARDPLPTKIYSLYNPAGAYASYVMPGIIIIILQQTLLVGIGLVGGARKEKGKKGMRLAGALKGHGAYPILTGRAMVYFFISCINATFSLVWVYAWFGFPAKGELFHIAILMVPYIFSVIFLGLSLSQLFKRREHAIMFLVFMSPLVLFLSGLSWPASTLPQPLYWLAHIFPSTVMVPGYLRLRTMGVSLSDVQFEFWFMTAQMVIYYFLSGWIMHYAEKKRQ